MNQTPDHWATNVDINDSHSLQITIWAVPVTVA
jgi:hypothetical protein